MYDKLTHEHQLGYAKLAKQRNAVRTPEEVGAGTVFTASDMALDELKKRGDTLYSSMVTATINAAREKMVAMPSEHRERLFDELGLEDPLLPEDIAQLLK